MRRIFISKKINFNKRNIFDTTEELNHQCEGALENFRKQLMEDYEISSEIVHNCASIIQNDCEGGLDKEGTTIHCIMSVVHQNPDEHQECQEAVCCIFHLNI